MKVAIRIDDVTPDMDYAKFKRFRGILEKLNIKPIIGVVPDNKDPLLHFEEEHTDFWAMLRDLEASGWVIAMHGMNHVYETKEGGLFPLNHFSEFAGVPYERQLQKIKDGFALLKSHGLTPLFFMAPGHTFDGNTLKALKEVGIWNITDGFGKQPFERHGMTFYPIAEKRAEVFSEGRDGFTTLVYHLNGMQEEDFEREEKWLRENFAYLTDFPKNYLPKRQTIIDRLTEILKANAKRILVKLRG